jgi:hypothetical protein
MRHGCKLQKWEFMPKSGDPAMSSAKQHAAELEFLKQLRGKTALLHVVPYHRMNKREIYPRTKAAKRPFEDHNEIRFIHQEV